VRHLAIDPEAGLKISVREVLSLVIGLGGVVLLANGIYHLLEIELQRKQRGSAEPQTTDAAVAGDRTAWTKQLHQLLSDKALTRAEFDQLKRHPAGSGDRLDLIQQLADLKASGLLSAEEFAAKKHTVMLGDSRLPGRAAD
jgi:hypothetical protein